MSDIEERGPKIDGVVEASVHQAEDGTWGFFCPGFNDSRCGDLETKIPFVTIGWPEEVHAHARGVEHIIEHLDPTQVSSTLEDFRAKHGIGVTEGKAYSLNLGDLS